MGSLINFDQTCKSLKSLKNEFNCSVFVETGCFRGNSLGHALNLDFERFFSCDIDKEMIDFCLDKFKRDYLHIHHGTSVNFLKSILSTILMYDDPSSIMFYLDAHLPEHDKTSEQVLTDNELNFPLEEELEIINKIRSNKKDVIIIDDLRIYEDGPFTGGNWTERHRFNLNLDFLNKYNYKIEKFYHQEGYILLTR